MNSTAKDIATLLDGDSSLGLTLGTDLFYSRRPTEPAGGEDNVVTVYDNPGSPPLLTYQKSTSNYFFSSVTVQVRNQDYDTGYAIMDSILTFLHASSNIVIGTTYYALIRALNDPQVLKWDDNDRVIFFINFEVQRRED
jgi:hypothetical protein